MIKSHAKINLILKVFNREDNLHHLLSLIDKIELHDTISLTFNNTGKVTIKVKNAKIKQKENTIYKALTLLKKVTKYKQGVHVEVIKNIPLASGLGGGSSNAAAVLKYVNSKLKLKLSDKKLIDIAFKVGSDTPSFLIDGPVVISGYGQNVESVNLKQTSHFLIVKPEIGVSSKQAYQFFDIAVKPADKTTLAQFKRTISKNSIYKIMSNDLEGPVTSNVTSLNKLRKTLLTYGFDKVMMTGSGSAFIAFSSNKKLLLKAKKELAYKYPFVTISKRLKTR
jgi:4-diphosphocytidyl-2-C-methyl-D-erythritol kinase